jgi:methylated-DNA-[protein]-cysteine S-methyltransferase
MNKNFNKRCYQKLVLIPKGMISTYAEIAKSLDSKAYRAVGNAMANNPHPLSVPCHRIIRSDGLLGGYALGINKKIQLLKKEGILIKDNKVVDFASKLYQFK